jgi:hypothetical protein
MNPITITYTIYLIVSVALTIWVARTLHKNGRVFLVETFNDNTELADSVNHLLVVGFYLVNIGYICLALKTGLAPADATGVFEVVSTKVGIVMLVLGALHFMNIYIFMKLRRRNKLLKAPPPLPPTGHVNVAAPPA